MENTITAKTRDSTFNIGHSSSHLGKLESILTEVNTTDARHYPTFRGILKSLDDYQNDLKYEISKEKLIEVTEIVSNSLSLNQAIPISRQFPLLDVIRSPQEFLEVMQLRSEVYNQVEFTKTPELNDPIKGLNYHKYDRDSVVITYRNMTGELIGTISFILNSEDNGLPSDIYFDSNSFEPKSKLAELTRLAIKEEYRGYKDRLIFRSMYAEVYKIAKWLEIDYFIMTSFKKLSEQYMQFGSHKILNRLTGYGDLKGEVMVLAWNPNEPSEFFKNRFIETLNSKEELRNLQ